MTLSDAELRALRVAVLAPTGKDATLTSVVLGDVGISSIVCRDLTCVERAIEEGIGSLLVTEEAISHDRLRSLSAVLDRQPKWSDLPVLLLTRYGADSVTVSQAAVSLGNVTLLERPVRPTTLLSAVRASLKARERQYQVRDQIAEQLRVEEMLREADRRKDEFLATLAHELRNPLAPIRNSLHILRLTSVSDPAVAQVCAMMERQVGNLVRLVDDLMEVSRITRGKVELRLESVEMAGVIYNAIEASRPVIESFQHQLAISIPTESLTVNGDPVRLSQIIANLLNNAAKYMNEGGQIWLNVKRQDAEVLISVRDSGIGISAGMLPHIFKMFTQVDRSTRQSQGGLGIGLTIVRTLVELHGGRVEAHSRGLNEGSEFVVRLPLDGACVASRRGSSEASPPTLPRHRVLVVDDNRDAAISLGLLLKLLGSEVQVVNDGPAALEILQSYRPTVVLLDLGMPGMDGYEVARRIREQPEGQTLMLIALTGWGQEEDRRRTSQAGFDHHLLKPADMAALKSLFSSIQSIE